VSFDYSDAPYPVPDYKAQAHRGAWDYMAAPGSWWTGEERIAIAEASRAASDCTLCVERKSALSPNALQGAHDVPDGSAGVSPLSDAVIDAVHRITTDPARLTRSWVESLLSDAFTYGHYVEMVSVIVNLISIDTLHRALGLPLEPLPAPIPGEPDGYQPPGAAVDVAWVPMIYPENLAEREADIYFGAKQMGHVIRAMSLVPEAVRWLNRLSEAHYLATPQVRDLSSTGHLVLSRMQTELVATRTSYYNDCFY
jgi:hypothetical protein